MPRPKRADEKNAIYHAFNRGNARSTIFHKDADYEAFENILSEGLERYPCRILAYQLMPNHWHFALQPTADGGMSNFLRWVSLTHTMRYHAHYSSSGEGHVYQGRFKSFPVQDDDHFLTLCRYVERNAMRAGLVARAEDWRWGSLYRWNCSSEPIPKLLSPWPIRRPPGWLDRVNTPLEEKELDRIRWSIRRGSPLGDAGWVESIARRLDLESTLRPRGRPKKRPPGDGKES
ncbi:transposase [Roseiconus lacunae]|uniref:Transposase n=1 Tax=Roseiconus lacunae TaxID=2605694 RepID=A0ABT7PCS6_9BACT|nr:transposase [Roseiconus lacunae]MCD0463180.1 transposase [Roseiconus lacunae]MDM4014153.1 transposase [Roseiconus lacunae]WRQ53450.1 transposase [Stieleria sp. HD01]